MKLKCYNKEKKGKERTKKRKEKDIILSLFCCYWGLLGFLSFENNKKEGTLDIVCLQQGNEEDL